MAKSAQAFRTIREVADWLDVAAHVLRFWESKFSQIKPVKRAGGRRYYRPVDMELVGGIKVLLHDRGLTIRGVQKMISDEGVDAVMALSPPIDGIMGEDAKTATDSADVVDLKPAETPEPIEASADAPEAPPVETPPPAAPSAPDTPSPSESATETSATPTALPTPAAAPTADVKEPQADPKPEPVVATPTPEPASSEDAQPALPLAAPPKAAPASNAVILAKLAAIATAPTELPPAQLTAQIGALRMLSARMARVQTSG